MKQTILFIIFTSFLFINPISAQPNLTAQEITDYSLLSSQLEGTYQIQMIGTRSLPSITLDLFPRIEMARKENETVFIILSDQTRIKVFSRNYISSDNFVPAKKIVYINSTEL